MVTWLYGSVDTLGAETEGRKYVSFQSQTQTLDDVNNYHRTHNCYNSLIIENKFVKSQLIWHSFKQVQHISLYFY